MILKLSSAPTASIGFVPATGMQEMEPSAGSGLDKLQYTSESVRDERGEMSSVMAMQRVLLWLFVYMCMCMCVHLCGFKKATPPVC